MGADPYLCVADPTGRLPPLWDGPLRPGRDSDHMNTVGEPYSGKPNVRFDEGRPGRRQPNRPPTLPGIARIAGSSGRAKSCRPRIVVPARGFEPRTLGLKVLGKAVQGVQRDCLCTRAEAQPSTGRSLMPPVFDLLVV